jgi:hypothetical protein
VEIAPLSAGRVGVRDSKNRQGPALILAPSAWNALLNGIKAGEFDRLT